VRRRGNTAPLGRKKIRDQFQDSIRLLQKEPCCEGRKESPDQLTRERGREEEDLLDLTYSGKGESPLQRRAAVGEEGGQPF